MSDGSCNTIDDSYARIYVSDKLKSENVKVLNLMSKVDKTRFLVQHESFECKCWLLYGNENVCDSKQKWNHDKYLCDYLESIN